MRKVTEDEMKNITLNNMSDYNEREDEGKEQYSN